MQYIQKIEFGQRFLSQTDADVGLWNLYVDVFMHMCIAIFDVKTCSRMGGHGAREDVAQSYESETFYFHAM